MDGHIVSDKDLVELTGYKIPSKQCEALIKSGIFFITRRDGRPRTTWEHFNDPLAERKKLSLTDIPQPDFGALD